MNRLAVVLIAMLLTGCVATIKRDTTGETSPISMGNWQTLTATLRDAPVELRHAIMQAGEARLGDSYHAESLNVPNSQECQAVLVDILTHTRSQTLLPDAAFASMNKVVIGESPQLQQTYASALANYLTQSDFSCRHPLYAGYFQRRYASANTATPCPAEAPFSVASRYDGAQAVWLEPKRVSSIHLLFASKSESMASRFGHVALRLVVCPEGKATAAECDANLLEHLVLGFRAHIDELSLNTLKALNGEYKAYLFANRFMDVYEEYAIGEFREVYSLPLRLDDAQRELMVRQLADIHWRYAGKYSFFTQNCATILQDALRVSWPEFATNDKMKSNYFRPDSLFEAVKSSSLAEGDKLASLDVAEREGYFFSSARQFYDRALTEVRNAMKAPTFSDIESYLQIDPIKRQQERSEDRQFSERLAADQHVREAQIMLEEYATLRSERLMMIEGAKYFEQQDFLSRTESIRAQLDAEHGKVFEDCLLAPIRQHYNPIQRLNGIPDKSDIPAPSVETSLCQSKKNKQLLHEAIAVIKDAKSEQWQRLNEITRYWAESIAGLNLLKQL